MSSKTKRIFAIVGAVLVSVLVFAVLARVVFIPLSQYNSALKLMENGEYAKAVIAFKDLGDYKDSKEKVNECKYAAAMENIESGDYIAGYEALIALGNYNDCAKQASAIFEKYKVQKLKFAQKGDIVYFGTYEQDNNTENGAENIEWLVLDVVDGQALVVSKYALDAVAFHTENVSVSWEKSALRKWLIGDFLDSAFSEKELTAIPISSVEADYNEIYETTSGNSTNDKLFLLSVDEAKKYFAADEDRQCTATEYAVQKGVEVTEENNNCWWWLRTTGAFDYYASYVFSDGEVLAHGGRVANGYIAARPAMWIDLSLVQ